MPYRRGNIILVPFPFTDLSGRKKRPGLVVSADTYNTGQKDVIVAQISSVVSNPLPVDEYAITGWRAAGLLFPSVVRPKLFTIEGSIIIRTLGQVPTAEMGQIDQRLRMVLSL